MGSVYDLFSGKELRGKCKQESVIATLKSVMHPALVNNKKCLDAMLAWYDLYLTYREFSEVELIELLSQAKLSGLHAIEHSEGTFIPNVSRRNFNPSASRLKSYWKDDLFAHSDIKYRLSYTLVQLEVQPTIRTQSDLIAHDNYLDVLPHGTTILFDHYDDAGPSVKRVVTAMHKVLQARPDIKIEQSSRLFKKTKELIKNS